MHFRLAEIFAGQKAQTPKAKMECMTKKEEKKWARKIMVFHGPAPTNFYVASINHSCFYLGG